jgi:hypothetical protein
MLASQAIAGTGTVIKYDQPIGHLGPNGTNMMTWGEDIPSDVDWNKIMTSPTVEPNWVIADDFRDPFDLPVITVKWWGSYVGPTFRDTATGVETLFGPGSEDGYLISFFSDIPDPDGSRTNPEAWSRPGTLLGSYVLPFDKVRVKSTPYIGWHEPTVDPNDPRLRIWEYEADLMDAHFDHGIAGGPAHQNGFDQKPGTTYWLSIVAEVGHKLEAVQVPGSTELQWISQDTGKFAQEHYWGWHTSPRDAGDLATMSHLFMPGNQWEYLQGWQPIDPRHGLHDMAFQLKTIPEPSAILLATLALVGSSLGARRRRS